MRVDIGFGRFGAYYSCCECGADVESQKDDDYNTLVHPKKRGLIFKQDSDCQYAGQRFKRPFNGVELEPADACAPKETK